MDYWKLRDTIERERLLDSSINVLDKNLKIKYMQTGNFIIKELNYLYSDIMSKSINVSAIYDYQRYYQTLEIINEKLRELGGREISLFNSSLTRLYESNYNLIGRQYGFTGVLDPIKPKLALMIGWVGDGKNYSDRIWNNKEKLLETLQQGLFDSITLGRSSEDFTKEIMYKMSVGYTEANRLARTESAHIYNESALQRYKDAGIKEIQVLSEKNEKTCKICKVYDGRRYFIDDTEAKLPLYHP